MDRDIVFLKLQDIFRDIFDDDTLEIYDQMAASDIEAWDSIMHINFIEAVQDEIKVIFDFDEIAEMM